MAIAVYCIRARLQFSHNPAKSKSCPVRDFARAYNQFLKKMALTRIARIFIIKVLQKCYKMKGSTVRRSRENYECVRFGNWDWLW